MSRNVPASVRARLLNRARANGEDFQNAVRENRRPKPFGSRFSPQAVVLTGEKVLASAEQGCNSERELTAYRRHPIPETAQCQKS